MTKNSNLAHKLTKQLNDTLGNKPTTRSATLVKTLDVQGHVQDDSALFPPESGPAIETEMSICRPGFRGDPDGS